MDEEEKINRYGRWLLIGSLFLCIVGAGLWALLSDEPQSETYTGIASAGEESTEEGIIVYVTGGVRNPGVYEVKHGSRVYEAIQAAGDVIPYADSDSVNMAEMLRDSQKIYIPVDVTKGNPTGVLRVNINTADVQELQRLPGVGEKTAQAILLYRQEHGLFRQKEDLKNVPSVGDKKYARWAEQITL